MDSCSVGVAAQINGKEQPNQLYVHGSVLVYSAIDEVAVMEAVPQGFNPKILLLDVSVKRGVGPMKGTCRPFLFTKDVDGRQYDQVTVRFEDGTTSTAVVSFLG